MLIHSAPEPVLLACDADHDLASRAGESHPHALPEPYVTWSRASASYLLVLFRCPLPKPDMSLSVSSGFPVSYPLTPSRTVPVDVLVAPGTDDQSFATA
jgi:DNA-binding transcriptional LysR family regulator